MRCDLARFLSKRGGAALLSGIAVLTLAYAAMPYVALWRLYAALNNGSAVELTALVDWQSVRDGVKQDIDDGIIGMSAPELVASNTLPPFGSGFAAGIAGNIIDRELTPEAVQATIRSISALDASTQQAPVPMHGILRAFFDSPRGFELKLRAPGCDPEDPPLRVRLALEGVHWRVVRVWVPQEIVERMQSRT